MAPPRAICRTFFLTVFAPICAAYNGRSFGIGIAAGAEHRGKDAGFGNCLAALRTLPEPRPIQWLAEFEQFGRLSSIGYRARRRILRSARTATFMWRPAWASRSATGTAACAPSCRCPRHVDECAASALPASILTYSTSLTERRFSSAGAKRLASPRGRLQ
jgi:hypothetical protein